MSEQKMDTALEELEAMLEVFAAAGGKDFDRNLAFAFLAADAVYIEEKLCGASSGRSPNWMKLLEASKKSCERVKSGFGLYRALRDGCDAGKEIVLVTEGGFLFKLLGAKLKREHLSILVAGGLFSIFTPSAAVSAAAI